MNEQMSPGSAHEPGHSSYGRLKPEELRKGIRDQKVPRCPPGFGPNTCAGIGSGARGAKNSAGARAGSLRWGPPGFNTST